MAVAAKHCVEGAADELVDCRREFVTDEGQHPCCRPGHSERKRGSLSSIGSNAFIETGH